MHQPWVSCQRCPIGDLSQSLTRLRLADNRNIADLQEDVRSSISQGLLRSIEAQFFNEENETHRSRQTPNLEKVMENLIESTILRIASHRVIVCKRSLESALERCPFDAKRRSKLKSVLKKHWGTSNEESKVMMVVTQCYGHLPLPSLLGIQVGSGRAHFFEDECRFRHALGLADAVHMSMLNLGVQVKFPRRIVVPTLSAKVVHGFRLCRWAEGKFHRNYENPVKESTVTLNRLTTTSRRFRLVLHYLRVFPKKKMEKEYVKIIKESLVDLFCVKMDQERPDISICTIPIFPIVTQERLDRRYAKDKRGRVRFYKNLLESKSLCAPVGEDMIKEAYEKHKASLCRPESDLLPVPDDYLEKLYKYGQQVGKFVQKVYKPYETKLPNRRATVESSRRRGGARTALDSRLEVQKGPFYLSELDGPTRVEPYVIGLFGPPGSGKTTAIRTLTQMLGVSLFPARTGNQLVYSRSCSTKHWDGYDNQPIVVMDDFGQDLNDRSDLVEFEQLVSTNRYLLPMANLEEKGRAFTSPIIILTSNMAYGQMILTNQGKKVVEDDMAVWRRFHFPLYVSREAERRRFREYTLNSLFLNHRDPWMKKYRGEGPPSVQVNPRLFPNMELFIKGNEWDETGLVASEVVTRFRAHTDYHSQELTDSWRQIVSCLNVEVKQSSLRPLYDVRTERLLTPYRENDLSISYVFPRNPPYHAPIVEAVAIPEPLKVRMITKAEADTKVLQPLQKALFAYLRSRPQFDLTNGVTWGQEEFVEKLEWIYRIEHRVKSIYGRRKEGDLWLSGDYTAATDNFPMSVTNALVEGILSQIDHEPTKAWVRYEVSSHIIQYPMGLGSGRQTSGQLMGSLLSFPLLCFLNDFIVKESGFEDGKYLINGDDVVALGPMETISKWRRNAPQVGLSLSLGKNFIDHQFCTVNSQLFFEGEVLHTGKVSLSTRYGKTLSRCWAESQFYYGDSPELAREFIRRNLIELRKTPRSLGVPTTHGGLGLFFNDSLQSSRRAVEVYLADSSRPFSKSIPMPAFPHLRAMRVPVGIFSEEEMRLGGGDPEEIDVFEQLSSLEIKDREGIDSCEMTHEDLSRSLRLLRSVDERLCNQLSATPITRFPPLSSLRYKIIYVEKGKVGFLKERILKKFLQLLLDFVRGKEVDGDQDLIEILREYRDKDDPLFGDLEVTAEESVEDSIPTETDYVHLLPGLEPRYVPCPEHDVDLVYLVRDSGT